MSNVRITTVCGERQQAPISGRPGSACEPGRLGFRAPTKPDNEVTTDSDTANAVTEVVADPRFPTPANEVTTDSGSPDPPSEPTLYTNSKRSVSNCEPYREVIERGLNSGRNAMAIWQDLVIEHGFERGYQSVKWFVHKLRPAEVREAQPVIVTAPGEEGQVDYGTGPMVRDQQSGKYRRRGCS